MTRRPPSTRVYLDQTAMKFSDQEIIVDSFAGGGGASLGISWALGRAPDIAINHDKEAIALHKTNHPESEHYPEDIWHVDPVDACRGRKVGLMWLSPDCKHFSKAKGGKPVSKKIRGLAWTAVRWAKAVQPRVIMLENVEEFEQWGPLYPADHPIKKLRNRPIPEKRGLTFTVFTNRLRRLGYQLEWKTLRACDYGAPTIRNRFFMIARCDGLPIVWPEPTHGKNRPHPWRTAAECIDWSIACPSIFDREERGRKALKPNTMRRIARGVKKFVLDSPSPFIVGVGGRMGQSPERAVDRPYHTITSKADSAIVVPHITKFRNGATGSAIDEPMPTVTANSFIKRPGGAAPLGLVSPVMIPIDNKSSGDAGARAGNTPLTTITTENRHAIVAPSLVRVAHGERDSKGRKRGQGEHSIEEPIGTLPGSNEFGLVAPFLKPRYGEREGQAPRGRSLEEPAPVIVPTGNGGDLVATFLAKHNAGHEATGQSLDDPMHTIAGHVNKGLVAAHLQRDFGKSVGCAADMPVPTITPGGGGKAALVASSLVHLRGTEDSHLHGDSLDDPMRTISASGTHAAQVCAFLFAYYGTLQQTGDLTDPAPTVTSKDRFGLCVVPIDGVDYVVIDIGMRMLQPRELYRAQGFPDSYIIDIDYDYERKPRKNKKSGAKAPKRSKPSKSRYLVLTTDDGRVFVRKPLTKTAQVRMCGNSVPPQDAEALVSANCPWLARREAVA